jgi:hypothetical protein
MGYSIECCDRRCRYTTGDHDSLRAAQDKLADDGGLVETSKVKGEFGGLMLTCPNGHSRTRITV